MIIITKVEFFCWVFFHYAIHYVIHCNVFQLSIFTDGALAASILVPLIVIVLLVAVFVALFSLIYIRRKKKFHIFTSREPMYEEPQKVNGIPPLLEREESDYTLPSTRDGNGQYLESIVLPDKATDSKEAKI